MALRLAIRTHDQTHQVVQNVFAASTHVTKACLRVLCTGWVWRSGDSVLIASYLFWEKVQYGLILKLSAAGIVPRNTAPFTGSPMAL